MEELMFEENYAHIYVNKEDKYLRIVWNGFVKSENFQKALNFGKDLVFEHDLEGWYANLVEMKAIKPEDQEWTNEVWFPEIIKSKLLKMAVLNSKHAFNKIAVDKILTKASEIVPFDTMYFDDPDKALDWILSRD